MSRMYGWRVAVVVGRAYALPIVAGLVIGAVLGLLTAAYGAPAVPVLRRVAWTDRAVAIEFACRARADQACHAFRAQPRDCVAKYVARCVTYGRPRPLPRAHPTAQP